MNGYINRMLGDVTPIEVLLIVVIVAILGIVIFVPIEKRSSADTSICKSGFLFDRASGRQIISVTGGGIECTVVNK